MDQHQFDDLTRRFASGVPRRSLLRGLAGFALGLVGVSHGENASAADARCRRKPDGRRCGQCGVCQNEQCIADPGACDLCSTCSASLRCVPTNEGGACSSCGTCHHGKCQKDADRCGPCERYATRRIGNAALPICESRCPDNRPTCCADGSCIAADACCPGEVDCPNGEGCCPEGLVCTRSDNPRCCRPGDVCQEGDRVLCCEGKECCRPRNAGDSPWCCGGTGNCCGQGECCDAEHPVCCGDGCCDSQDHCTSGGDCCSGSGEICVNPQSGQKVCCDGFYPYCCGDGRCVAAREDCCDNCATCEKCDLSGDKPRCVPDPDKDGKTCGRTELCRSKCDNGRCRPIVDGEACPDGLGTCCGGIVCCTGDSTCCDGECCDSLCILGLCCDPMTSFVAADQSLCCPYGPPCGGRCCGEGDHCCDGVCCGASSSCCDGVCRAEQCDDCPVGETRCEGIGCCPNQAPCSIEGCCDVTQLKTVCGASDLSGDVTKPCCDLNIETCESSADDTDHWCCPAGQNAYRDGCCPADKPHFSSIGGCPGDGLYCCDDRGAFCDDPDFAQHCTEDYIPGRRG